jgi:AcrR family transcriptional regulator
VLEGAARVFDREGLDATTNRIAQEAGVSVGTLYEYFPNKQTLLLALAELHLSAAVATVHDLVRRWGASPPATMSAVVHDIVALMADAHRRHPSMHRLLTQIVPDAPELLVRARQMQADLADLIADAVQRLDPECDDVHLRAEMVTLVSGEVVHGPLLHAETEHDVARWTQHLEVLLATYLETRVGRIASS